MEKNLARWIKISLISLVFVAIYGTLMRYKIAFSFPFFEQKNLLHAHSHFAFSAWITHLLYCGLSLIASKFLPSEKLKKYERIIIANLLCAYGMLIAFTAQGYATVSISLSTLSIFIAVVFAWNFIKDIKYFPANHPSKAWIITGLLLHIISSAGPFSLAYMMATKNINHEVYLGSVYYYLHFQYNGWFFFGTMAIIAAHLPENLFSLKKYFWLFAPTAFLTFFLSVLWLKLPLWLYIITVIAAFVQLFAWAMLLVKIRPVLKQFKTTFPKWVNVFFYAATLALSIKFLLQAVSVIPSLSQFVFGMRPIVIAYIHLVLLGIYSLFFIGYLLANGFVAISKTVKFFAFVFLVGVLINELLLGIQGIAAFAYFPIAHINEMLLGAAVLLLTGAAGLAFWGKRG